MNAEQKAKIEAKKRELERNAADQRKANKAAKGSEPQQPVSVDPVPVAVYFEPAREKFWHQNASHEWQPVGRGMLDLILRSNWYSQYEKLTNSLTKVEEKILSVVQNHAVHYAGELAGWKPGVQTICGNRVLITRGPRLIEPKREKWLLIKSFLSQLLGDESRYFYAWMRAAFQSLRQGPPFAPGQMFAVAGPAGCGKSLLQMLVTEMLGGRMAKPYRYLMGLTPFNGDLIGCEHQVLDDEVGKSDIKSRRHFGSMVKAMVANKQISAHPKGSRAFTTEPFWRISISMNDEPESLMILPPLDADIEDKIILVRARKVEFPYPSKVLPTMQSYWDALKAEVPAYLYALLKWEIPADIVDARFGVKAYHNAELLQSLSSLSPESKLWGLIEHSGILSNSQGWWSGSATDLERDLKAGPAAKEAEELLYYNTAAGVYLGRLARSMPANVAKELTGGHRTIYTLSADKPLK